MCHLISYGKPARSDDRAQRDLLKFQPGRRPTISGERRLRILLVDDAPARVKSLRELIYSNTWSAAPDVEVAGKLPEILARAIHRHYHVVLLDARWADSATLVEKLRADHPDSSVILLGDPGDERTALELVKIGARDFLERSSMTAGSLAFAIRYASQLQREEYLRQQAQDALQRSERDYRNLFEGARDSILIFDPRTELILEANPRACQTYDLSREELLGLPLKNFLPAPEQTRLVVRDLLETREPREFETIHFARDGRRIDMLVTASVVEYGGKSAILSVNKDVTESKRAEIEIERLAYQDPLTGLANRLRLEDRLQTAIAQAAREGHPLAVLYLDLDRFKLVNDSLGHRGGDALLQLVAERLTEIIRGGDTLARLGGDEFVLVLYKIYHPDDAAIVARKVLEVFSAPFEVQGREIFITTSIGISVYPDNGQDTETLVKNADIAMYRAKQQGRNAFQSYVAAMEETGLDRLSLETDLHRALATGQLSVVYQPILDLKTGKISGAEALVRWPHPDRGLLIPGQFLSIAEDTGLILRLGDFVLREACKQTRRWRDAGSSEFRVSVNLSASQFQQSNLSQLIGRILEETGVSPEALDLEITETVAMKHLERTASLLGELTRLGIKVTMDDFGTGYSSLTYLKRFPISTVKIDQSFIRDLAADSNDASIVRAMIVMSHELRMRVVAEGVETQFQRDFLSEHGCDEIQGYLISPPLPPEDLESLMFGREALPAG